ncbi:hypothetical protein COS70_02375, partial [Candidatus Micrarchaeota archaeon CG06_land_8_20_14_3_00_50_6]
ISMASLTGKIVLITGSSIGIGRESAFLFSREGCTLILTYCKDEKEAADAAEKCRTLGAPEAFVVRLDVTDDENILGAVKKISEKFDKIDILVNNAGVILWKPFKEQTFDEIQSQCRVNYEGLVKFTLACLPLVKETIINIASGAGKEAYPKLTTYCGTKFAVRGFTQALAQELKDIMVYCVNLGVTATRMTGFEGIHPSKVAEVIVNTAKGAYVLESGDDVDVWDYFDDAD